MTQHEKKKSRGKWLSVAIGLAVSAICVGYIVHRIDPAELRRAVLGFNWTFLVVGLIALSVDYWLRIVRWALMLRSAGGTVDSAKCVAPFLGSIALNNVLPLRLGDAVRAFVFPSSLGITRALSFASLVMERLLDLVTIVLLMGIGLWASPDLQLHAWVRQTVLALGIVAPLCLGLILLTSGALASRLERFEGALARNLRQLLEGFGAMSKPSLLWTAGLLSLAIWLGEATLFYCLLLGFGLKATFLAGLIIMALATLATLVPSSPGYIGPFHLAAFAGMTLVGGTTEQGASFALIAHLSLWLPTTLAGALCLAISPGLLRGARTAHTPQPH
ncbi:lysylphosphatidylglycerol synthase transmembrane domain-containing protein [Xenophilus aerolatus]|nr:lysylphosphatidylglycerol synthase transmembrane domain-containing protein [Xenophilus aerolatus]